MNIPRPGEPTRIVLVYEDVTASPPVELGRIRWTPGELPAATTSAAQAVLRLALKAHDNDPTQAIAYLTDWSNGYVRTRPSTKGSS